MTTPLIHLAGDTARARATDSPASHIAADRSSFSRKKILLAVLEMVREDGPTTGVGINEDYPNWVVVGGPYFPRCAHETPRKRLEEAAKEGLVEIVGTGRREEAIYAITDEGLRVLRMMGR